MSVVDTLALYLTFLIRTVHKTVVWPYILNRLLNTDHVKRMTTLWVRYIWSRRLGVRVRVRFESGNLERP